MDMFELGAILGAYGALPGSETLDMTRPRPGPALRLGYSRVLEADSDPVLLDSTIEHTLTWICVLINQLTAIQP